MNLDVFWKFFTKTLIIFLAVLCLATHPTHAQEGERELFIVAQKAFEDGFYDVALRYIDQLFTEYPQTERYVEANLLKGQCHFFKSQYLKAYETFQPLLSNTKLKDATLYWIGETYLKGSDYIQAQKHYKQLIELYPDSEYTSQAYYSLGWVYFEQKKYEEAKETFTQMVQKFPLHQLSQDAAFKLAECDYNLRNYEDAIKSFEQFIQQSTQSKRHAEAYFYIGESYYYLGKPLEATRYYAQTADKAYDKKLIFMSNVSLGWCYLRLEKYDLSEKYFLEAYESAKGKATLSDDVFLGLANLYTEMKQYSDALKAYHNLISQFPNSTRLAEAYVGIANIYYQLKNYKEAAIAYKLVIDRYGKEPDKAEVIEKAHFGLAWSHLKNGDIDQSIKTFELIKNHSDNTTVKISALTQIGDAYQDVGELQKAVDVYDQILSEYSDSLYTDYVQYRQGIALLKMDKIETATLSFQSLKANFPDSKYLNDIKYYLAVAYFKKEDWKTAKEYIETFIEKLEPDSPFMAEAKYILAISEFNLGEYLEAQLLFESIIQNHPNHLELVRNSEINIAKCYYKLDITQEALKRFRLITLKYPESKIAQESLMWVGDHYLRSEKYDKAAEYYSEFIKKFPGSTHLDLIYYQLGQSYFALNQYEQAVEAFKKISDQNREILAKAELAIADIFAQELNPESAMQTYQNIIQTSPEYKRDAYSKIAEIQKSNEQFNETLDSYKQALNAEKKLSKISNAELQFYIGDTYELLNQNELAVKEYFKIPYLYPNETQWIIKGNLRIARIFEDEEKWDEAKKIYQMVIEYKTAELKFAQERLEWIENNIHTAF